MYFLWNVPKRARHTQYTRHVTCKTLKQALNLLANQLHWNKTQTCIRKHSRIEKLIFLKRILKQCTHIICIYVPILFIRMLFICIFVLFYFYITYFINVNINKSTRSVCSRYVHGTPLAFFLLSMVNNCSFFCCYSLYDIANKHSKR